ncbi:NAD(P)/FAD-dependent oxidoreductase [Streptomyces cavernae]|uniref:NAD(P)/FAD-dependent oxidoreductase n=1 Tax=Streptomyces cavernae TaxID=2259034 RepID=UPI000FEC0F65|nr:FAD-dependent oxidoreductase [Streptomyces cavernae]
MTTTYDVVVVGAGHAGVAVVSALAKAGFAGSVAVLGDEPVLPYERPPLSKEYLTDGGAAPLLRTEAFWSTDSVQLELGAQVTTVDPAAKLVHVADGRTFGYRKLVWATGADARALRVPGATADNLHSIRRLSDVDRLRRHLTARGRAVIIGGGYIGLETAAVLTGLGHQVTVVEAVDRVLARVTGPVVSRFYQQLHERHGVRIVLGETVAGIATRAGRAHGVHLGSGELLPADVVIVGVGAVPAVEVLQDAGAAGDGGLLVDDLCRTTLPDVHAIGDCALQVNRFSTSAAPVRLESVSNANHQAKVTAAHLVGAPPPVPAVPWFWSNQYDVKLQTAGLFAGHDEVVTRGEPDSGRFSVLYLARGRLLAADCVNVPADFAGARRVIGERERLDTELAADPGTPLKTAVLAHA